MLGGYQNHVKYMLINSLIKIKMSHVLSETEFNSQNEIVTVTSNIVCREVHIQLFAPAHFVTVEFSPRL